MSPAQTFAANVKRMIASMGASQASIAVRAGVPYRWLRRVSTDGISRANRRGEGHLVALAEFFGVPIADFWEAPLEGPPPPVLVSGRDLAAIVAFVRSAPATCTVGALGKVLAWMPGYGSDALTYLGGRMSGYPALWKLNLTWPHAEDRRGFVDWASAIMREGGFTPAEAPERFRPRYRGSD